MKFFAFKCDPANISAYICVAIIFTGTLFINRNYGKVNHCESMTAEKHQSHCGEELSGEPEACRIGTKVSKNLIRINTVKF
jgi:hypothetical protein